MRELIFSLPYSLSCGLQTRTRLHLEIIALRQHLAVLEAFPFEAASKYLLRDRDAIYGHGLQQQIGALGTEVLGACRSAWQRAYIERIIGSIRRDCLDQMIVFNQLSLRRILRSYLDYYHGSRTHLSLDKDAPVSRQVQPVGRIVAIPQVGGLHHRYERRAA